MSGLFDRQRGFLVPHTRLLLDSFRYWLGRELIPRSEDAEADARSLFEVSFVVLSSGVEPDPILSYANRIALALWELDWDTLTRMPARKTAEPVHRAKREAFLAEVRKNGYVDDYSGIRIASNGTRFEIKDAIVWNLVDAADAYRGQAATFSSWRELPAEESCG